MKELVLSVVILALILWTAKIGMGRDHAIAVEREKMDKTQNILFGIISVLSVVLFCLFIY